MPSPAITRPGASRSSAVNCAASTALGTRPTRATSVPRNGPSPPGAGGRAASPARRGWGRAPAPAARAGPGARCGRSRTPRPRRPPPPPPPRRRPRRASPGRSGARRRSASPQAALARRQRRAHRPGPLAEGGGHDHRLGAPVSPLDQLPRRWRGRRRSGRSPACTTPPPSTKHSGSSTAGQVGQAEADPPPDLLDDPPRGRIARRRRRRRRPRRARSRDRRRPAGPPRPSRPASAASRASTPSPAPDAKRSQQPRRPHGHGGPAGSTTMWPISPAKPAAPTWTRPSITMPPPMPVPSVTMHDVVVAAGGAQAVLGEHGEVGVVLDDAPPAPAAARRSARSSPPPGPAGRLGAKHSRPAPVHHARGAHADGHGGARRPAR